MLEKENLNIHFDKALQLYQKGNFKKSLNKDFFINNS